MLAFATLALFFLCGSMDSFFRGSARSRNSCRRVESSFAGRQGGDLRVIKANGVLYRFRCRPPGGFTTGSPETEQEKDDDEVPHGDTLTHGFWLLETEVTQLM